MNKNEKTELVPVWEKAALTLEEAVAYSGIGRDKLCKLSNREDCDFILWIGRKRLFKRKNWMNTSRSPFPSKKGEPLWEKQ